MPAPNAPTNVLAQAGDNQAYLSWALTPTATSYSIQRSIDGVNFSTIANPTFNSYSDPVAGTAVGVTSGLTVGLRYQIQTVGTSTNADFTTLGVPSGTIAATGVTFIAAATGAGSGTGTVVPYGNLYYYQVAAVNGSGTSPYTSTDSNGITLAVIPVPLGQTTLGTLRAQAQQRSDMVNSNFVTVPEWNENITQGHKELFDGLIAAYGNDYYIARPFTYTTSGTIDPNFQASVYPLPQNFYKLTLCEVALNPQDPNSWVTLRQYERIQQNLWNFPNVYTFYGLTNLRYRLTGNQLQIVPIPSAGQTVRIWFVPRPIRLVADTDLIDGISGWEEYVILFAAIKALKKEESDAQAAALEADLNAMRQRLEAMAANRNVAEPQRVSDSRTRNFGWSDDWSWNSGGQY